MKTDCSRTCGHRPFLLLKPEPNENCFAGISLRFIALLIACNSGNLEVLELLSDAGADWSQPMRFHYSIGSSANTRGPLKTSRLAVRELHPIYWVLKHRMPSFARYMILEIILEHCPHAVLSEIFEVVRTPVINFDGVLKESIVKAEYTSAIALLVSEFLVPQ